MEESLYAIKYPVPNHKQRMTEEKRAAQFAPFAALEGYGELAAETARVTDRRRELTEEEREALDRKIQFVKAHPDMEVRMTCFEADTKKEGGTYLTVRGVVQKISEFEKIIWIADRKIPFENIVEIAGVDAEISGRTDEYLPEGIDIL